MRQIIIDDNNAVIGFCEGDGYVEGAINVKCYPDNFAEEFVPEKWLYINGEYMLNPDYEDTTLLQRKIERIIESKAMLAEWLANNPMLYSDGKHYSVTEEKQTLLNNNLTSFERAEQAGIDYPLKWNATGEECTEWEYDDLLILSLTIAGYVAPKVAAQQAVEIEINACETAEQLAEVVIDYGR
jgi:hypothetical protein